MQKLYNLDLVDFKNFEDVPGSKIKSVQEELINKVVKEFHEKLEAYVKENLRKIGFTFKTQQEFYDFVSKRVLNVSSIDRPEYHQLQLDTGEFIGSYSTETTVWDKISNDRHFMNIKIG